MYSELEKQLKIMIDDVAPTTIYPRMCKIIEVNNETSVNVLVNIGEPVTLHNILNIGHPEKNNDGILIPINGNWQNGICVSDGIRENSFEYITSLDDVTKPTDEKIYFLITDEGVDLYIFQDGFIKLNNNVNDVSLDNYYTKDEIDSLINQGLTTDDLKKWLSGLIGDLKLTMPDTSGLPGETIPYTVKLTDFYGTPLSKEVSLVNESNTLLTSVTTDSTGEGNGNLIISNTQKIHATITFKKDYTLNSEEFKINTDIILTLITNKTEIKTYDTTENLEISASCTYTDKTPIKNATIDFYINGTKKETLTTNDNGVAGISTYTPLNTELIRSYAVYTYGEGGVYSTDVLKIPAIVYNFNVDSNSDLYLKYADNISKTPQFTLAANGDLSVETDSITTGLILTDNGDLYVDFD